MAVAEREEVRIIIAQLEKLPSVKTEQLNQNIDLI